jgi:two-component system, cell cycle response regulator
MGYSVVVTRDGNEAWQALQTKDPPQIAILDWKMPGLNGLDVCRKIRQEVAEPYIYLILLTGYCQDEHLVAGMEAGADDYIAKPFKTNELRVRLRAGWHFIELQNELIAAREIHKLKSTHDSLTGLLNHEKIMQVLDDEVARADREGTCVAVIMADLDHFKSINDTYGNMAGDSVLRSTAGRLVSLKRPYDSIGRYGGEEFFFILPNCCRNSALNFAERVRTSIAGTGMDLPEGTLPVTISLGVAVSSKERRGDLNSLAKAADAALYKAKERGRNRVDEAVESGFGLKQCPRSMTGGVGNPGGGIKFCLE